MNTKVILIPKIIMQTWKSQDIPDKWKSSPASIKKYMPTWKYHLMTDEMNRNFVIKYFPEFLQYYDNFKYAIQRADAIRYLYLYVNGGLYIDLDMEITESLEPLFIVNHPLLFKYNSIDYQQSGILFLSKSANYPSLTNSIMASIPHHPIWIHIINAMKETLPFYVIGKHWQVMVSTGPNGVDRTIKTHNIKYNLLDPELINSGNICNMASNKNAIVRSLEGGSWHSWDSKIFGFCRCNIYSCTLIMILIIISIIILFIVIIFR